MNLVSLLVDLDTIGFDGDHGELIAKTSMEVYNAAPKIKEASDLGPLALDLLKFFLQEIADDLAGEGVEIGAKKLAGSLNVLSATLNAADKLGGAGQVLQRQFGLLITTPMETALILVGKPFKLDPFKIDPALAAPGDEVQIQFQSAALTRMFDPAQATDLVSFEGPSGFHGEVLEVTGTTNAQMLRMRIPVTLGANANGSYTVYVNTQGRRGQAPFQLLTTPFISAVTPMAGFAAVDDFIGAPFGGSPLRVKGALFSSFDRFFFVGGDNPPEVSARSGSVGNVKIQIPKGARSSVV